jgi:hypothetical protein
MESEACLGRLYPRSGVCFLTTSVPAHLPLAPEDFPSEELAQMIDINLEVAWVASSELQGGFTQEFKRRNAIREQTSWFS